MNEYLFSLFFIYNLGKIKKKLKNDIFLILIMFLR